MTEDTTARRIDVRLAYLGMTRSALADALSVWPSMVSEMMSGKRNIAPILSKMADVLGVEESALQPGGPWERLVEP